MGSPFYLSTAAAPANKLRGLRTSPAPSMQHLTPLLSPQPTGPLALPRKKLQLIRAGSQWVLFGGDCAITGAFPSSLLLLRQHVCLSFSLPSFLSAISGMSLVGRRWGKDVLCGKVKLIRKK